MCLIDECDKLTELDSKPVYEVMENHPISISKAGIFANLWIRSTVIAAAYPIKRRYDIQLFFADNINLSDPILSIFDTLSELIVETDTSKVSDVPSIIINTQISYHPNFD